MTAVHAVPGTGSCCPQESTVYGLGLRRDRLPARTVVLCDTRPGRVQPDGHGEVEQRALEVAHGREAPGAVRARWRGRAKETAAQWTPSGRKESAVQIVSERLCSEVAQQIELAEYAGLIT